MKTDKIPLSLMPSDIEEESQVLDTIAKRTDKQKTQAPIVYPYPLTAVIKEVIHRAEAKIVFTVDEKIYSYNAITTQALKESDTGRECLVSFVGGKIDAPVITGIIQSKEDEPLVLSSQEGIALECGETRIVLDAEGTLDLKALHINSQAYGPFRIKGASVKIN